MTKPAAPALVARRGTRGDSWTFSACSPSAVLGRRVGGDLPAALRRGSRARRQVRTLFAAVSGPASARRLAHGRRGTGTQDPEPPSWPHRTWAPGSECPGASGPRSSGPTPGRSLLARYNSVATARLLCFVKVGARLPTTFGRPPKPPALRLVSRKEKSTENR